MKPLQQLRDEEWLKTIWESEDESPWKSGFDFGFQAAIDLLKMNPSYGQFTRFECAEILERNGK